MPVPPTSIFDSSALLALLKDERGADVVEAALAGGFAMNLVNWAEVLTWTIRRGGAVNTLKQQLNESGILSDDGLLTLLPISESDAEFAANLYPSTRHAGLSLGDRLCIATANRLRLPVLTADQAWSTLPLPGVNIQVIR